MITYEDIGLYVNVKLEGKHVGTIVEAPEGGFRYQPKGSKNFGETFATRDEVKASLEGDS
jgi:hypothetical protein